ncbi:iron uptake porin [Prochlorococcus marinus]|uniref:iron uptake porin n=1 Tax=Prochlorococcus marinus TaxID=1219 RepID=UPI0022B58C19|nr:iron uptake porin [Prochlorococcus marinus]
MKLFQQLLLAPAALGLLAPLAANAAEVNINDVASYANKPAKQANAVRSTQYSDVVPGDWAYTALQNLGESYGCVDNAYTQNLKSGQALTRYEAAALINACLEGGLASADVDSDAVRLSNEFGTEMAILKGRVDGLEYKVKELSAGQFSSTTKLDSKVVFNTGYISTNKDSQIPSGQKLTTSYVAQYNVNTSFSGKDRLYTRIKAGNMASTPWEDTTLGTHLSAAHKSSSALKVDKLWYEFPIGDNLKVWGGPLIENYYMLASSPSIYKPVLKQFALGGNAATYGSSTDGGFGVAWTQSVEDRFSPRFAVSTNYVAKGSDVATQGLLTNETQAKWLSKIEYGSPKWQVSLGMAKNICAAGNSCKQWSEYYDTKWGGNVTGDSTAYALRGYIRPDTDSQIVPDLQVGFDWVNVTDDGTANGANTDASTESASAWMVGMMWADAFIDGNRLGAAFGGPQHATDRVGTAKDAADGAFAWELYYDYKVSDGITVTPAIFGASSRYDGSDASNDFFGALVQTTFKF